MKKISFEKMFRRQKKIRVLTVLCLLFLVVAMAQLVIARNPKSSNAAACTITTGDIIPADCENQDVIIRGADVNANLVKVWQTDQNGVDVFPDLPSGEKVGGACNFPWNPLCDSKRHFKSLKIVGVTTQVAGRNGDVCDWIQGRGCTHPVVHGSLTHSGVTLEEMYSDSNKDWSLADETTGTARWKKVDLVIDTALGLALGGRIDVSGKGYYGSNFTECKRNYEDSVYYDGGGPGHGYGAFAANSSINGAGGGYGGLGGGAQRGWGDTYPFPFIAQNMNNSTFDFGSGGGASHDWGGENWGCESGGNGGGRIHIEASEINIMDQDSTIVADGIGYGDNHSGIYHAKGGGGSGGMIWLVFDKIYFPKGDKVFTINYQGGNGGGVGTFNSFVTIGNPTNISVKGGVSEADNGGGGGGRIILGTSGLSGVSIKKTLTAVSRPWDVVPKNPVFNPYALLVNDRIAVDLSLSGLVPGKKTRIEDDLLSNGTVSCNKNVSDVSGNNGGVQNGAMVWLITPAAFTEELKYECTIQ